MEQLEFDLYGLNWSIRATPTAAFLTAFHTRLSTVVLFFGLIMSVLLGWIVHAYMLGKDRAKQLQRSARHLATLLENLPGMAYRCRNHKNWPVEFVSDGCLALSGYSKKDFEEHRVYWSELVHPEDRQELWQDVQKAISSDQHYEHEYRIINRDGSIHWVWGRGRKVGSPDGIDVYLEGFIT